MMVACASPRSLPVAVPGAAGHPAPQARGESYLTVGFEAAFGKFRHETFSSSGGSSLDDETSAMQFEFAYEAVRSGIGGGVLARVLTVDDDLHQNATGITSTDTNGVEVFGHFTAVPQGGTRFRMPIRVGPYFDVLRQDITSTVPTGRADLSYLSLGVQLAIEPEFDLLQRQDQVLSVFAGGDIGFGVTVIDFDEGVVDEDFETVESRFGLKTGVRFRIGQFQIESGFLTRQRHYEESDPEPVGTGRVVINEADMTFSGFFLTGGVRF